MAYEWGPRHQESYAAGADLREKQFHIGQLDADRTVSLAGAGEGTGVIDTSSNTGETVALVTSGTTKVACGAAVEVGDRLIADATGRAIPATAGTSEGLIFGTARESGSAGTIIAARVEFSGAVISAAGI